VRIAVELNETTEEIEFVVADDGLGFEATSDSEGAGVENMRDRLDALGGRLKIDSAAGGGTTVSGAIPLAPSLPPGGPSRPIEVMRAMQPRVGMQDTSS
jgi:signal transduction histidine kinase